MHLGGCTDLAIMAGRGALCPERKLKGHPPVSSRCSTPGCRSVTGIGLEQPSRKPTTMTLSRPMFPPRDPTRRRLLTVAAGGAAAAVTGIPASKAAPALDPIYAAIEAHRRADAAADGAFAESSRLYRLANEMVGPSRIEVPNMVEPGTTAKVLCFYDVEQVIPHEQYPDLNDHYCRLLEERSAARFDIHGDTDELTDGLANAAWDARDAFAETVPTTLPGLLAMILSANELSDAFTGDSARALLQTLATAAEALIGRPA
jgi:hypothetical protein